MLSPNCCIKAMRLVNVVITAEGEFIYFFQCRKCNRVENKSQINL